MKRRISWFLFLTLLLGMLFAGCAERQTAAQIPEATEDMDTISVAIYPYVPDRDLFKEILTRQWEEIEPDVELTFDLWDCYGPFEPEGFDILMYDAVATARLVNGGYIQPIDQSEIEDMDGMLSFAVEGAVRDGKYYGIPFLVCAEFLMHHKDDTAMYEVDNFAELVAELKKSVAEDPKMGLSTNYSDQYIWYYLDALMDFSGEYSTYEEAPVYDPPNAEVMARFREIQEVLASDSEEESGLGTFSRADMFNDGYGRVHFGYSEDMSFMEDRRDDFVLKFISFSEKENVQLCYADNVSVSTDVKDPGKLELCKKLMNVIASEEFQQELCFGSEEPQYMLPVRKNLYDIAAAEEPLYGQLKELIMDEDNKIFLFGSDIITYQNEAPEKLK